MNAGPGSFATHGIRGLPHYAVYGPYNMVLRKKLLTIPALLYTATNTRSQTSMSRAPHRNCILPLFFSVPKNSGRYCSPLPPLPPPGGSIRSWSVWRSRKPGPGVSPGRTPYLRTCHRDVSRMHVAGGHAGTNKIAHGFGARAGRPTAARPIQ